MRWRHWIRVLSSALLGSLAPMSPAAGAATPPCYVFDLPVQVASIETRNLWTPLLAELALRCVPAAGQPLRIGVSMGVAVRLSAADTADGLIQRADEAMYEAKRAGGNRWVLHHSVGGQLFSPA